MATRNANSFLYRDNIVPPLLPTSLSLSPLAMNDRLLMRDQLASIKGIEASARQLRRWIEAGHFPKPVRISEQRVAWRESDINAWIASRPVVGSKDDPQRRRDIATGKRLNDALDKSRHKSPRGQR